jgi:hypothetical protein
MERKSRFNWRAFVSLAALFSGLGLPITGIPNHVHQFEPMNTVRHAWMAAHNSLGLLFVIFALWHVLLNRRALFNHIRGLAAHVPTINRETMTAFALVAIVLFLFVGHAFHLRP